MILSKLSVSLTKKLFNGTANYSNCPNFSYPKHIILTLLGAATPVGKIAALLLKQNPHVNELRLYDNDMKCCTIAADLSQINSNTKVIAYSGLDVLKDAITDSQIIVICTGKQKSSLKETQRDLFEKNAGEIQSIAIYTSEFNPNAVICIATPPINALVPMVSEEYRKAERYNYRKIIGITNLASMRTNSIIGDNLCTDPSTITCPVIGGFCPKTIVPVLSQTRPIAVPTSDTEEITQEIQNAENEVLEAGSKHGIAYSPALAISRFITALAKALKGEKRTVECSFVRQVGHIGHFLKYMTSIVKLGKDGIESSHMPKISSSECAKLQDAADYIQDSIALGEAYITGAIPKLRRCLKEQQSCDLIKPINFHNKTPHEKIPMKTSQPQK